MTRFPVEICIDARDDAGVYSAVHAAWLGGADRIELCSAMHLDGLTPDARHIRFAREAFADRPGLLVMIRLRAGDFFFSPDEVRQMLSQIETAHRYGANGVVLGVLQPDDSRIAQAPMQHLVRAAKDRGLAVTVHRAFDATPDSDEALDALIDLGVDRVLTSGLPWGQPGSAVDGLPQLLRTVGRAAARIEVVIGGGVNPRNAATLAAALPDNAFVSFHAYSGAQQDGVTTEHAVRTLVASVRTASLSDYSPEQTHSEAQRRPMNTSQTWNPESYARNASFVAQLGEPLIDLLAPQPGERVLDLGCGNGVLTEKLAAAGCVVVAVDGSPAQVAAAQARGLDARVADGQNLPFDGEFDAVFSNAALHWMRQPDRVIAGVARALKPGGRFVGEMGGAGNIAAVWTALTDALARRGIDAAEFNPWYFPTAEEYRAHLETGGFSVHSISLFPRPTPLPGDISGWLETFGGAFLSHLDGAGRAQIIDELREALRPALLSRDGVWIADYVRLRFSAVSALS